MTDAPPLGTVEHLTYGQAVRHAYRVRTGPGDPYKALCGRQLTSGTSRGHIWRDFGPADADALEQVGCAECRAGLVRLGYALAGG